MDLNIGSKITFTNVSFNFVTGARVWIKSEIQRGQVHNRTGPHGERERLGLAPMWYIGIDDGQWVDNVVIWSVAPR